ncbi:MAG TPA: sigma-70 family RNA polymerase sigma factor [Pirellulales bacterium]|nr:sigma-70 family RNA polymerase sigma factor [Pirellulales bacterium]
MPDEVLPDEVLRAEAQLSSSWSLGSLRPWLKIVAERELPACLRGRVEASDIVQQTLLDAWRGLGGFRGKTQAERLAWLRAILRRVVLQQGRSRLGTEKRGRGSERLQSELALTESRIESLAGGDRPTPAEQAATNEASLLLARAIESLSPDDQQLIRLRHFEQLSHEAIAVQLGCSPATVRMRWVRALRKLRDQLGGPSVHLPLYTPDDM